MVVADVHSNIGLWSGDPFIWSMTALLLIYQLTRNWVCLLYTSPSPRDRSLSRMPSSA